MTGRIRYAINFSADGINRYAIDSLAPGDNSEINGFLCGGVEGEKMSALIGLAFAIEGLVIGGSTANQYISLSMRDIRDGSLSRKSGRQIQHVLNFLTIRPE